MTASPKVVLDAIGGEVPVTTYAAPNLGHYTGINNGRHQVVDYRPTKGRGVTSAPAQFVDKVLHDHPEILRPGAVVFGPANMTRNSHHQVREMTHRACPQAVVAVINGKDEKLYFYQDPEGPAGFTAIDLIGGGQIADRISGTIERNPALAGRPLVYTGYKCISMGATLVNSTIGPFTSAIIYGTGSDKGLDKVTDRQADNLMQLAGRAAGRMVGEEWEKHFVDGRLPATTFYWPGKVGAIAKSCEYAVTQIAEKAVVPGQAGSSQVTVTAEEYVEDRERFHSAESRLLDPFLTPRQQQREAARLAMERLQEIHRQEQNESDPDTEPPPNNVNHSTTIRNNELTTFGRVKAAIRVMPVNRRFSAKELHTKMKDMDPGMNVVLIKPKTVSSVLFERWQGKHSGQLQAEFGNTLQRQQRGSRVFWVYNNSE